MKPFVRTILRKLVVAGVKLGLLNGRSVRVDVYAFGWLVRCAPLVRLGVYGVVLHKLQRRGAQGPTVQAPESGCQRQHWQEHC